MKSLLLLFIITLCSINVHAQDQCEHQVSTDPDNPSNESIPNNPEFLNSFEWNPSDLGVTTQTTNMDFNQNMLHIMSPQQPNYYNYIYNGEQPSTENGWELLLLNIGTYPDLSDFPDGQHSNIPYIVLYNRYSGMMRVFANIGDGYLANGVSIDAVKVVLYFDDENELNGNIRLMDGVDRPLDQPTKIFRTVSVAKHPNLPNKWFSADFQVTYDPCVCFFPSRFRLDFELIESETLELHGREISVEQDIIDGNFVQTKDYLSNFDYTGNTADGGVAMYRTLEKMVDDYESKLIDYKSKLAIVNEHNEKVERNLIVIKLFKHVIIGGGNSTISAISNMSWFPDAIVYANDLIGDTLVKKEQIVEAAKKTFAAGLDQFITKNLKKKPTPTSPSRPVATYSEMHFSGDLNKNTDFSGPNFYTPGTYGTPGTPAVTLSGDELAYPVYNERLGSFALLKSPKLKLSRASSNIVNNLANEWIQDDPTNFDSQWRLYSQRYQVSSRNYQIQLAEDLVYAFNTALDIKSTDIQAAFVIKAIPYKNFPVSGGIDNAYLNKHKTTNVISTNRDVNEYYSYVKKHETNLLGGSNFPQFSIDYNMPLTVDFDSVMFETSFFPIDAFRNNTYAIGLWKEHLSDVTTTSPNPILYPNECEYYPQMYGDGTWCYPTPEQVGHTYPPTLSVGAGGYLFHFEIVLKLIVDIEFETLRSDGTPNSITQTYSYVIPESDIDWLIGYDLVPNLEGTTLDINQYPENLALSYVEFDGSSVDGCTKSGTHYTCKAWNNISIDGELTTSSGHTVDIIAGNEIVEIPGAEVSPEITRQIEPVLDYSHPMPEVDEETLISFCGTPNQASGYQASKPEEKMLAMVQAQNAIIAEQELINGSWDFDLFPNPASSQSIIRINSETVLPANIGVTDVLGKEIQIKITNSGENTYFIDLSHCRQGVYFVTVSSFGGAKTKQLIVQ